MSPWAVPPTPFCIPSPSRARLGIRLRHRAHRRHLPARALPLQSLAFLQLPRAGRPPRRRHPHHPRRTQTHGRADISSCKTVTGKSLGENIDEWDLRSEKCTAWAQGGADLRRAQRWCWIPTTSWDPPPAPPAATWRPSRCSFSRPTPARSPSGASPPPSMRATRHAAAALFAEDGEFQVDETLTWKGRAEIEAGLEQKFAEFKGLGPRRTGHPKADAGADHLAVR